MKATQMVYSGGVPEVKPTAQGLKIDYGTIVLELTHVDIFSLLTAVFTVYPRAKKIVEKLK